VIEIEIGEASGLFQLAVQQFRHADTRDELSLKQIPAPGQLAKESVSFAADIAGPEASDHIDAGTGRFVLMYDPASREQWGGEFRIVTFSKSPMETFISDDERIADVAWAWLMEALANRGAEFIAQAATVTRVINTGFGSLAGQSEHAELEMRASWTPVGDFGAHIEAWQDLVCMMSGYPLLPVSVASLHGKKR